MLQLTSREAAAKIMGPNYISLKEVLSVFPYDENALSGYETVPFNQELLYWCSEPENEFVLVPGICEGGKKPHALTIVGIRNYLLAKYPNLFAPCRLLEDPEMSFVNNFVCHPRWYLIAKKAGNLDNMDKVLRRGMEMVQCPDDEGYWEVEKAVVYIYTWVLFYILRGEEIFSNAIFVCSDTFSLTGKTKTCLKFVNSKIIIAQRPNSLITSLVPSIRQYAQ